MFRNMKRSYKQKTITTCCSLVNANMVVNVILSLITVQWQHIPECFVTNLTTKRPGRNYKTDTPTAILLGIQSSVNM